MFMKTGTLRAALGLARDEKMLDGQDPMVVMNGSSEAQLDATVQLEIEVRLRGNSTLPMEQPVKQTALLALPQQDWPALLKMYVSITSLPLKSEAGKWPGYLFARRFSAEPQALTRFLGKLSDRRLKFGVNVVREPAG